MDASQEDNLLSINEAADEFDISRIKLYRWMKDGELEWYRSGRDGRVKYVRREDVERLLIPQKASKPCEQENGR